MFMYDDYSPPFWTFRRFAMLCGILVSGYFFAGKPGFWVALVSWLVSVGEFRD